MNGAKQDNRFQHEIDGACYTGRDVVVQGAVWAGDDVEFFAQIQNIRREGGESDEKDNEKKCFPFMKRSRSSHESFSCRILGKRSRNNGLVKRYS